MLLLGTCLLQSLLLASATSAWDLQFSALFDFTSGSGRQARLSNPDEAVMADHESAGGLVISDVLGGERSITVFSGIVRDVPSVSTRFEKQGSNYTVLAPSNGDIMKLPRKPWESPADYQAFGAKAYEGGQGEGRAQQNLVNFIEAHVVPQSPWNAKEKASTLNGKTLWFEEVDGKKMIKPDNVEVVKVADTVSNGEVWVINGVLNYA